MSLKMMVIDDEPLTLKVMRSLAVPLGHSVLTVADSQEAAQLAEKQRFDAVFLGMPRSDGLELAGRILNSHSNSNTTVVMLVAPNDIETLRKAFGAGITFVLPKPIVSARLIPVLTAMETPGWKLKRHAARLPLFTDVTCKSGESDLPMRSLNISESGMLLQGARELEVGQNVSVEFKIAAVRASLNVRARIIRKQGTDCAAVEFVDLAPEDQNSIQLYVMGRLEQPAQARDSQAIPMAKVYFP